MTKSSFARWLPLMMIAMLAVGNAQQGPAIGLPVTPLGEGPFVFDTAEQQKIRVSVVTRGLSHPWSLAFLPDGSLLVTERPGRLRIVRNGVLDPTPIAGVPRVRTGCPTRTKGTPASMAASSSDVTAWCICRPAGISARIREVRQGPDGLLYLLTYEDDGALLRIDPVS